MKRYKRIKIEGIKKKLAQCKSIEEKAREIERKVLCCHAITVKALEK